MRAFLKKAILFSVFVIPGYCVLILVWGMYAPDFLQKNLIHKTGGKGHMFSRMQEVKTFRNADIVFVGSSLCIRGFDTRIFAKHGYRTFNLGSGGQTPLQSLFLIKKYVDQLNPKLVILEVNPYIVTRDGVEAGLDLISNHDFDPEFIPMAFIINNVKILNATIFSFWKTVFNINKDFIEDKIKNEDTYVEGGYIEKKFVFFNKATFDSEAQYDLQPVDYQEKALNELIDFVKSKKIKLVLIHTVVTRMAYDTYKNNPHFKKSEQYFSSIGNYFNCNEHLTLNDTLHFYDSRHLNQNGVELFNEALINNILNLDSLLGKSSIQP